MIFLQQKVEIVKNFKICTICTESEQIETLYNSQEIEASTIL